MRYSAQNIPFNSGEGCQKKKKKQKKTNTLVWAISSVTYCNLVNKPGTLKKDLM